MNKTAGTDPHALESLSRALSGILRHKAPTLGLRVDKRGWVDIEELLALLARQGHRATRADLDYVVTHNDKQRFAFSDDGARIRANQGHSFPVELDLKTAKPPPVLYHGTIGANIASIRKQGLLPMNRHDVHLSATSETALRVGARRGRPVILVIETFPMVRDGYVFSVSENNVWLVPAVPAKYIRFPE